MPENTNATLLPRTEVVEAAAKIVAAYVSNNPLPAGEIPAMLRSVYATLAGFSVRGADGLAATQKPAVPVRKSVTPEHIVCLEDGKKLKMLKRYLRSRFGLSPDEYRAKWNLPVDYPMTAPNYAALRSQYAKKSGLGRSAKHPSRRKQR